MSKLTIKEYKNDAIGERYLHGTHSSGLQIFICPKEAYSSAYALFGTRYGSIDTKFRRGGGDFVEVPEGIAHFLEHKLFESEDGDAFARYAKTGASANAYTSFDRTCYLFSCSERFHESFEILLDFVQSPYFTKETVDKEQGIIGQEIRMYDDNPDWRVFFNLLVCMYKNHPVRIDIAGTVDSIAEIDDKLLYECYNTFYNLNNMFICIAGNIDVDAAIEQIEKALKPAEPVEIERGLFDEPAGVVKVRNDQKLAVSLPLFCLGFKELCDTPERSLQEKIATNLLLEIIAGEASPLYRTLLDKGLINKNFGCEYFTGHGYAAPIFQGESKDPDKVAQAVKDEIARLKKDGIDSASFEGARRAHYGRSIMRFNSVQSIASGLTESAMHGDGFFDDLTVYGSITVRDVAARLSIFKDTAVSLSVISPAD